MNQNQIGIPKDEIVAAPAAAYQDGSEASFAAHDFAFYVQEAPIKPPGLRAGKDYEVRPCRSVRGHVLRLPITGWVFWFPTVGDALNFTRKLAGIHSADCCVYDSEGGVLSRLNVLESPAISAN